MSKEDRSLTVDWIGARIHEVRGQRVMLDSDLARIYGVPTKALLQQVRRNASRCPEEFAWQVRPAELTSLRSQIVTSNVGRGGWRSRPWVFTEHGAVMLANVLKSPAAVLASVEIVRAFVRLRGLVAEHHSLSRRSARGSRRGPSTRTRSSADTRLRDRRPWLTVRHRGQRLQPQGAGKQLLPYRPSDLSPRVPGARRP